MKNSHNTEVLETVDADREAYFPIAAIVQDEDYIIRGCDGDNEYLFLAVKKQRVYVLTEVYPGLSQRETNVRDVRDVKDLTVPGQFRTIEKCVETVRELLFEGFEFGQRERLAMSAGAPRALRAINVKG